MLLKISTATTVTIGPVLDADGAAVTTAVVTNFSIVKNGSSAALTTETLNHIANGYYTLALTSTNTNTLGNLEVFVNNTAMSMTMFRYNVIAAQVYDSLVSGSDLLQIDIQQLVGSAQDASRILIGATAQHEVAVTGSNHVAADVHEFQPGVITSGDFASGAITSTVLATDSITSSQLAASAVTEIQSGLATTSQLTTVEGKIDTIDNFVDTEVAAIKAKTDNLPSDPADASDITAAFTQIKGAGWTTTDTLEAIRNAVDAGGSGGGSIMVTPVVAQVPVRVIGSNIETFIGDVSQIRVGIFSGEDPVDLTSFGNLEVCVQEKDGTDLQVVAHANITIDGDDNNYAAWTPNAGSVDAVRRGKWSLRKASNKQVIGYGAWIVVDAALSDV